MTIKFTMMGDDGGSIIELPVEPDTLVGSAGGAKAASQARPDELVWLLSGEYQGERLTRDVQCFRNTWHKPEWGFDSKHVGADRFAKLTLTKREKAKELVLHLRQAEQTHFGCVAPVSGVLLTVEWNGRTVRMRPGPGPTELVNKLIARTVSIDWGCQVDLMSVQWEPDVSDGVLEEIAGLANWSWQWLELTCDSREECWRVVREIRTSIRKFTRVVCAMQCGPVATADWKLTAPTNGLPIEQLLAEQRFTQPKKSEVTPGNKPIWSEPQAVLINGEKCMVLGPRAWSFADCSNSMRFAPTYSFINEQWLAVEAPNAGSSKMVEDVSKRLAAAVRDE